MKFSVFILLLMAPLSTGFAQVDSFTVAGTHPQASQQTTERGKAIATLKAWNGKIYMGYGDYGANTGPISVTSYDPKSGEFTEECIANTESIYIFRAINGKLYAPAIDRKAGGKPGDYIVSDSTGAWKEFDCSPTTTHAFDMASLGGDDLWMAGSHGYAACLWRSSDGGTTWAISRLDSARSSDPNDFARYYFVAAFRGKLYVQARDYQGPIHPSSRVFDGIGWLAGPDLFPGVSNSLGWQPRVFNDRLVYRSWQPPSSASHLWTFDGMIAKRPDSLRVWDIYVDGDYVWTLAQKFNGAIVVQRSSNIESWEVVTEAPPLSCSLAIMDGVLYVGTKNAELLTYHLPEPSSIRPSPAPESASLEAYPNPACATVTISLPEAATEVRVCITDMIGRAVYETTAWNGAAIDVSGLRPGMYLISYQAGKSQYIQKLIIR